MRLPDNEQCQRVIRELDGEPMLTRWESDFIKSNIGRVDFTTAQKEVIAKLLEKYEI